MKTHKVPAITPQYSKLLFMKQILLLLLLSLAFPFISFAQAPVILWQKSLGGSNYDIANSVKQTPDSGYIVAGNTSSSDGDVGLSQGGQMAWIVKLDKAGNIQWKKLFEGTGFDDEAYSIALTADGGYIFAGVTEDPEITGYHGRGDQDYLVVKLDSAGNVLWERAYGGNQQDWANSIMPTSDGGYIVAGSTNSVDGDVTGYHPPKNLNQAPSDYWIIKIDSVGNLQWEKTLGGSGTDAGKYAEQTPDGGYIACGWSASNDGDVTGNHGGIDYWIVKLNNTGNLEWQKSYGSGGTEAAYSVHATVDGGYIIGGYSNPSGAGDVTGNHGSYDYWIVKIDDVGSLQWEKSFGGTGGDLAWSLQLTSDKGYVIAGSSSSNNGDVTGNHGSADMWVLKLDSTGAKQWEQSYGGSGGEQGLAIAPTLDKGYIVAGSSTSNDGEVTGNHGNVDYWVVKLSNDSFSIPGTLTSFSPTSGKSGDTITINGTGFTGATAVSFEDIAATSFTVVSPTKIKAVVGDGASGAVGVTIQGYTAILHGFTFDAAVPTITSFSPTSGGLGDTLTINGTSFTNATAVSFGGTAAASFTVVSAIKITAVLRFGASGAVSVTTSGGTATLGGFIFAGVPTITSFSPITAGDGDTITINGTGFLPASAVSFGGTAAASFKVVSGTQIRAAVGNSASGAVSVTTPGGTATLGGFIFSAVPTLKSFSPITAGTGNTITINGTGFTDSTTAVSFGGIPATSFTVVSATKITAVVGAGASGVVSVTTPDGTATLSGFTFVPAPVIDSLSKTTAIVGEFIQVYGKNLLNANYISFGGVPGSITHINPDGTILNATIGAGASGDVAVTTPGGSAIFNGFIYTAPRLRSATPDTARVGTIVTLAGSFLTGATAVSFGGIAATSFTVVSAAKITAVVVAGASGEISVTTPGGTATLIGFTFLPLPVIDSLSKSTAIEGESILVYGKNLLNANHISFGGIPGSITHINPAGTILSATIGAGSSGDVVVTTPGGSAVLSGFIYPAPILTSVTPDTAKEGTIVTLNGSFFTGATEVIFGGVPAASFIVVSDTKITAVTGAGASRAVSVTTPGGSSILWGFTYLYGPIIESLSKRTAIVGEFIQVYGANLLNATSISFGGVPGTITYIHPEGTILDATIGEGASGDVVLTTLGGTAVLTNGFTYTAPILTAATPDTAKEGTLVHLTGSFLTGATAVSFGSTPAASFNVDHEYMTAVVGAGASGKIRVTTPGGTAILDGFVYARPPEIDSLSKSAAIVGEFIQVYGKHLWGATSISFGGVPGTVTYVHPNGTLLNATVGAGRTGYVVVKTPGGTATLTNAFTYRAPILTLATPISAKEGTTVHLAGSYLTGATAVSFGGVPASSFSIVHEYMTAVVGAGASGEISVTTPGGTATLNGFTYLGPITGYKIAGTQQPEQDKAESVLSLSVQPNPSKSSFTLIVTGDEKLPIELRVLDMYGRAVHQAKGPANQQYVFGENFAAGLYVAEVIQGNNIKTIKMVKM